MAKHVRHVFPTSEVPHVWAYRGLTAPEARDASREPAETWQAGDVVTNQISIFRLDKRGTEGWKGTQLNRGNFPLMSWLSDVASVNWTLHRRAHEFKVGQEWGRNSQGNLYFDRETIYSYGSHFPIARHVKSESGRKRAVLFTTRTCSNTTARHCSAVRKAIPDGSNVFHVPIVVSQYGNEGHGDNLRHYASEIAENMSKYSRALMRYSVDRYFNAASNWYAERLAYARFFGLKVDKIIKPVRVASVETRADNYTAKADARNAAQWERERAARAERERIEALELPVKIAEWRGGAYVSFGYGSNVPTLLRLSDDGSEVETSRGARVPIDDARKALRFARAIVARGVEWKRNGEQFAVGMYQLDRISVNGDILAGCHHIKRDEWERLAPQIEQGRN